MSAGVAIAIALAVAAAGGKKKRAVTTHEPIQPPSGNAAERRQALLDALIAAGVTDSRWQTWAIWVAQGEARWRTTAWNKSASEVAASRKLMERLIAEGRWPCSPDFGRYAIGSGGYFGQLSSLTVYFLRGHPRRCDPPRDSWLDPQRSILAHFRQVAGTADILRKKMGDAGTMLMLRALYGMPSRDPHKVDTPKRRSGYAQTLAAAGISPAFLDERVPLVVPG